jgi:predicted O-linked N-acetylglucosamine transferase (SPINDLY family)
MACAAGSWIHRHESGNIPAHIIRLPIMLNWLKKTLTVSENAAQPKDAGAPGDGSPAKAVAPNEYVSHKKRGNEFLAQGKLEDAAESYRQAVAADPGRAEGFLNLGYVLRELGRLDDAEHNLKQALLIDPAMADACYLLGGIAQERGDLAGAIGHYSKTLELKPDFEIVYGELCQLLFQSGKKAEARKVIEQGLARYPGSAEFHCFLGNLYVDEKKYDLAIPCYQRALQIQPDYIVALSYLGHSFIEQGNIDQAIACYRKALAIDPDSIDAHTGLLFFLSFQSSCSPEQYLAEARRNGSKVSAGAQPYTSWSARPADGDILPLRVGLVSGDFRTHPVGYFLETVLAHLDPAKVELVAYNTQPKEDDLTARLKPCFSAWNSIAELSDEAAARKIHDDGIHILVDLSGHTTHNRLPVFAWKPAPVQVSWLGYLASTGMPGMDFILATPVSVPESHRQHFTEKVWYLPETANCLTPPVASPKLAITPPPSIRNGYITFGSFQNLPKISDEVLAVWGEIFRALPQARLRFHSKPMSVASTRKQFQQRLDLHGIPPDRVVLEGAIDSREDYLATHAEVDIILDSFPYTGITTTCEALWMGVPTITLAGDTMLSRQGASLLTCAGLNDWIANSKAEYIALAIAHAYDVERLAKLRSGLRQQVLASPLFNAPRFALNLETALQEMWQHSRPHHPPADHA